MKDEDNEIQETDNLYLHVNLPDQMPCGCDAFIAIILENSPFYQA